MSTPTATKMETFADYDFDAPIDMPPSPSPESILDLPWHRLDPMSLDDHEIVEVGTTTTAATTATNEEAAGGTTRRTRTILLLILLVVLVAFVLGMAGGYLVAQNFQQPIYIKEVEVRVVKEVVYRPDMGYGLPLSPDEFPPVVYQSGLRGWIDWFDDLVGNPVNGSFTRR